MKAELAQWLMVKSWQDLLAGDEQARPWPWADTRPVAILSIPRFNIEQFVLEGNSGRNLAFGPVFVDAASSGKDQVISGHRDTHFQFLQRLLPGDRIQVQTRNGENEFIVESVDIVDSRIQELILEPDVQRLSLVTCYPFDTAVAGGPLRYVVTALPLTEETLRPEPSVLSSG